MWAAGNEFRVCPQGIVPGYRIQVSRQHVFAFHKVQTIHQRSTRVAAWRVSGEEEGLQLQGDGEWEMGLGAWVIGRGK